MRRPHSRKGPGSTHQHRHSLRGPGQTHQHPHSLQAYAQPTSRWSSGYTCVRAEKRCVVAAHPEKMTSASDPWMCSQCARALGCTGGQRRGEAGRAPGHQRQLHFDVLRRSDHGGSSRSSMPSPREERGRSRTRVAIEPVVHRSTTSSGRGGLEEQTAVGVPSTWQCGLAAPLTQSPGRSRLAGSATRS